eukprot:538560-Alexandrium_andersonii.AAC.1
MEEAALSEGPQHETSSSTTRKWQKPATPSLAALGTEGAAPSAAPLACNAEISGSPPSAESEHGTR